MLYHYYYSVSIWTVFMLATTAHLKQNHNSYCHMFYCTVHCTKHWKCQTVYHLEYIWTVSLLWTKGHGSQVTVPNKQCSLHRFSLLWSSSALRVNHIFFSTRKKTVLFLMVGCSFFSPTHTHRSDRPSLLPLRQPFLLCPGFAMLNMSGCRWRGQTQSTVLPGLLCFSSKTGT